MHNSVRRIEWKRYVSGGTFCVRGIFQRNFGSLVPRDGRYRCGNGANMSLSWIFRDSRKIIVLVKRSQRVLDSESSRTVSSLTSFDCEQRSREIWEYFKRAWGHFKMGWGSFGDIWGEVGEELWYSNKNSRNNYTRNLLALTGNSQRSSTLRTTGGVQIPSIIPRTVSRKTFTITARRRYSMESLGGGPQGVAGRIPRMLYESSEDQLEHETAKVSLSESSPKTITSLVGTNLVGTDLAVTDPVTTNLTGLTLTDPYHLYLSLTALNTLQKDELQLRAMKQLQKLYHRIIDYVPPEEMLVKLSLLLRELELQEILIESRSVSHRRFLHNLFRKDPAAEKKQLVKYLTDEEELMDFPSPQGLLIYGEVGCGKSMLMDIFASSLPHRSKMRWHFNNFILWVYTEMHQIQQEHLFTATVTNGQRRLSLTMENEFILFEIAQKMISRNTILMLDEFMLPDIASANIIKILFTYYFKLGGVLVATSNKLPEDLYANEFHKASIKSFVEVLNARCQSVDMRSTKDYRTLLASDSESYLVVRQDNPQHEDEWMDLVRKRVLGLKEKDQGVLEKWPLEMLGGIPGEFLVYNRVVELPLTWEGTEYPELKEAASTGRVSIVDTSSTNMSSSFSKSHNKSSVVYLNFSQICEGLHSSSDYITLASKYQTVVLDGVPVMTTKMKNEARRFITLLDAIYESKCQFFMRSDVDIDFLFFPDAVYADKPDILKKLSLEDSGSNILAVQDEEMFAKTAIALSNPYRPNVSTYDQSHTETYDDYLKNTKVDFKNASAFTGEDEKFAYKRAILRIREMVNADSWRYPDRWVPVDKTMRPWERNEEEIPPKVTRGIDVDTKVMETTRNAPDILGDHHFWAMGPWTCEQGKRLKDSIAKSWLVLSMRNREG